MSIDYNEKFLELRKKLTMISEGNSEINHINNKYKNKLRDLELKTSQKLNIISDNFTSLKNDFISMNSNYFLSNNNNSNKSMSFNSYFNKSFDYSNYKKEENGNKNYIKNLSKKISEDINRNKLDQQNYINIKFLELENKIRNIFEIKQKNRNNLKRELILIVNNSKENIENINLKIEEKKNEEENILLNIGESFKKEMVNVNGLINEIKKEKENSNLIYEDKIKEINEFIQRNFIKERKKRENFQKNVLGILKDTCQRLTDTFYGSDNENEENEENDYNYEGKNNLEENEFYIEENNIEEMAKNNNNIREINYENENNNYINENNNNYIDNNYREENENDDNIYEEENNENNEEEIEEEHEQE